MCGLCGVAGFGDEPLLERMGTTIAHRGPDDAGSVFFPEERAGFGFRRLAIIDLSPAGHQPFVAEDEGVALVFNGEIYNHPQLRDELEAQGQAFRSSSDTEVILRLYQREGLAGLRRLDGMFALGILDRDAGMLHLVRDRLGIKPLYYAADGSRLAFGSEIKAVMASGLVSPDLDLQAASDYFTYLYVPCPATILRGVRQVPPAHVLSFTLATGEIDLRPYWVLDDDAVGAPPTPAELREFLEDAVRGQLISDVPLGLFLSGGIDSTILAGLMARTSSERVRTFTVVFEGEDFAFYDERGVARQTALQFGTDHTEIPVRVGDPSEMLRLLGYFDQPFGNPTSYLMRLISEASRGEVTVALCGAGGDELFAGYPRYRAARMAERFGFLPAGAVRASANLLTPFRDSYRTMTLRRARGLLEGWDRDEARRFVNWTYFLTGARKARLLGGPRMREARLRDAARIVRAAIEASRLPDAGSRLLEADLRTFLLDNLLEYTDKMSMSVGLEVRVPYLDHRFVAAAMRVPFDRKLEGNRTKAVLRDTFADLIPDAARTAPKKGFNVPLGAWMRDRLDGYFDRAMGREAVTAQGIFDWEELQRLRDEHRRGRRDNGYELYGVLVFDLWFRSTILGEDVPELAASR